MQALEGVDMLAIVTEWKECRSPDCNRMAVQLRLKAVFDGRTLFDPALVARSGRAQVPRHRTAAGPSADWPARRP